MKECTQVIFWAISGTCSLLIEGLQYVVLVESESHQLPSLWWHLEKNCIPSFRVCKRWVFFELAELCRQCAVRQRTEEVANTVHSMKFFTYVVFLELCKNRLSGFFSCFSGKVNQDGGRRGRFVLD